MFKNLRTLLISLFFMACGARTGILDDFEVRDAAPDADDDSDVSGDFPCNYSPTGEFLRIDQTYGLASLLPELAWGDGYLAIAYMIIYKKIYLSPIVEVCRQEGTSSWYCESFNSESEIYNRVHIAWGPGEFGVFWLENGSATRFLRITPPNQFSVQELESFPPVSECVGLVFAENNYFASIAEHRDALTTITNYDIGNIDSPIMSIDTYPPTTYAVKSVSDGRNVAFSWIDNLSTIHLSELDGFYFFEQEIPSSTTGHSISIQNREVALVWVEEDESSYQLLMRRIDLDGNTGEAEIITSGAGSVIGVDVIAVEEGHLVAFNEFSGPNYEVQRVLVTPTRSHGDFEIEARQTIEVAVAHGDWIDHPTESPHLATPSLAYDGLDAYLATPIGNEYSFPHVRLQKISCHR